MSKIYIHWFEMSGLIKTDDLPEICDYLNIPVSLLKQFTTRRGTAISTYDTATGTQAVYISIPAEGHGCVKLTGSYFNTFPEQSIQGLKNFLFARAGNCLRLDVSIKDTSGILDFNEYARMSKLENYLDYCMGSAVTNRKKKKGELPDSNNRQGIPDVHQNHTLIHYGDANSPSYAKLYVCPDGFCKFEITLRERTRTKALLRAYDTKDMMIFNGMTLEALVKTINFVTPASKRAKRPIQVDSYAKFLGGRVKPIKWAIHSPEKQSLTKIEKLIAFKKKVIGQLYGCISRFGIAQTDIETITVEIETRLRPQDWEF